LAEKLERDGVTAAAIHGNKSQGARTKALADFKQNNIRVLVATDIAARGLDIEQLPHVVNFELPNISEDYVHRIGRTGRAGATGEAISLVEPEEFKFLQGIEKLIKQKLPREALPVFSLAPVRPRTEEEVKADAEAERPRRPQHRPANRRTNSQKSESRQAAGLPPVRKAEGSAANKPRRRRPNKPQAVA
jgi:ATP-dependent RNA helicase RhlE